MAECMEFPKTAEGFIEQYKFTDTKQEYTNGAELISVFRVKQMMEHYFANDNNVGGWIPVTERLPDINGKYLVARKEGGRYSISVRKFRKEVPCWYTGYCGHWERRTNGITHWMPLPEPPKGE